MGTNRGKRKSIAFWLLFPVSLGTSVNAEALDSGIFEIKKKSLSRCAEGTYYHASIPLSAKNGLGTIRSGIFFESGIDYSTLKVRLAQKGIKPLALLNAGYFSLSSPVSFFKSESFGNISPMNSLRSPRACMAYNKSHKKFELLQSSTENYEQFKTALYSEVFCAGPELIRNGLDVSEKQLCAEQFIAECREDGTNSGISPNVSLPRSAACIANDGNLNLFAATSKLSRCGLTIKQLVDEMREAGCIAGMNLDGGGSTKLYLNNGQEEVDEGGIEPRRSIPVWIVIY